MITVILLFIAGTLLSAFFSGSETGFYRASRLRFALDGMAGDPVARGLLWFVNHPTVFVATTLVGNNLANYLVSFSIVLGTQRLLHSDNATVEILAPIVMAPIVFVYAELLPKNLYFLAPNKLLRWGGPSFILCGVLFAPFSCVLWMISRLLKRFLGESPTLTRLHLARKELRKLMDEGHEVGILRRQQRLLAQGVFDCADETLVDHAVPIHRMATVTDTATMDQLLASNRNLSTTDVLVLDSRTRQLKGYVPFADVLLSDQPWHHSIRPLPSFPVQSTVVATMMRLQSERAELGQVVDAQQRLLGIVTRDRLLKTLYDAS